MPSPTDTGLPPAKEPPLSRQAMIDARRLARQLEEVDKDVARERVKKEKALARAAKKEAKEKKEREAADQLEEVAASIGKDESAAPQMVRLCEFALPVPSFATHFSLR
jgi:hypothetical protein